VSGDRDVLIQQIADEHLRPGGYKTAPSTALVSDIFATLDRLGLRVVPATPDDTGQAAALIASDLRFGLSITEVGMVLSAASKRGLLRHPADQAVVRFMSAEIGQCAYTWENEDGDWGAEYAWETEDPFKTGSADGYELITRKRWRLEAVDVIQVIEPGFDEDDEALLGGDT
jgi:hypothetical protein